MLNSGQNAQKNTNVPDRFVRIEDKYLVPATFEAALTSLISRHLKPSYINDETTFTLIESIYFDSEAFDFFQDHFLGGDTRQKLRVRRYAPNGVWSQDLAFIEAKTKCFGVSMKERLRLDPLSLRTVMNGSFLRRTDALRRKNPALSSRKVQERINGINRLIEKRRVRPLLTIQYKRLAFESENVRVTLDYEMSCRLFHAVTPETAESLTHRSFWEKARAYGKKFSNGRALVVEIKHQGGRPGWLEQFMAERGVKCTGFSKYCWGVSNHIQKISRLRLPDLGGHHYASLDHQASV